MNYHQKKIEMICRANIGAHSNLSLKSPFKFLPQVYPSPITKCQVLLPVLHPRICHAASVPLPLKTPVALMLRSVRSSNPVHMEKSTKLSETKCSSSSTQKNKNDSLISVAKWRVLMLAMSYS